MHVKNETRVNASPEAVIEFMISDLFAEHLCVALDAVSSITKVDSQSTGEHTIKRILQYEAPTQSKIPSFLSKYKDKAPEFVYWKEIANWDLNQHTMTYSIEPDIPEKWQSYYDVNGELRCVAKGDQSVLITALTYNVNVFGLKRLIERALKQEVSNMLEIQGQVIQRHFNGRS